MPVLAIRSALESALEHLGVDLGVQITHADFCNHNTSFDW